MIEGRLGPDGYIESALGRMRTVGVGKARPGDTIWLALRPEKISMTAERPKGDFNSVSGTVSEIGYRGDMSIYKILLSDRSVMKVALANVNARSGAFFSLHDLVWLSWPPEAGVVLKE
jgi:putrescine transport system ATP-binding protein